MSSRNGRCMMAGMPLPEPSSPFRWGHAPWGSVLRCDALTPLAAHVFTARGLDLPHADAGAGWAPLAAHLGVSDLRLWRVRQVHGVTAHTADVQPCDGAWPEGDLLVVQAAAEWRSGRRRVTPPGRPAPTGIASTQVDARRNAL